MTTAGVPCSPPYTPLPPVDGVAALTGLPADATVTNRPILAVKIDNYGPARPQWGLDQADAIIEENVEGISRFVALFHSRIPDVVGPVRSARTADLDMLSAMNRPVFAYSGANPGVNDWIDSAASSGVLVDFNAQHHGCYSRTPERPGPHNLLLDPSCAIGQSPDAGPAGPLWTIAARVGRAARREPPTRRSTLDMDGVHVGWAWDAGSGRYLRFQDGQPHLAASGAQISARNVVELSTEYIPSPVDARSPNAITVGTGSAVVHRNGIAVPVFGRGRPPTSRSRSPMRPPVSRSRSTPAPPSSSSNAPAERRTPPTTTAERDVSWSPRRRRQPDDSAVSARHRTVRSWPSPVTPPRRSRHVAHHHPTARPTRRTGAGELRRRRPRRRRPQDLRPGRIGGPRPRRRDRRVLTGQFTAIMGPSGSGKSTLMHTIAGLDTLTSGDVFIGDINLGTLNDKQLTQLRRDRIGFIFQAFNLVPTLTALENITLPLTLAGRKADPAWLDLVVDTVGLGTRVKHRPSELSGGQQQRVAVARALASRPEIIFADEPTGNLDSRTGAEILAFMRTRRPRDGPDHRDGHPRPEGRVVRRPRPVPRRRPRRRRHDRPDTRDGARPHQEPRPLDAARDQRPTRTDWRHMFRLTIKELLAKKLRLLTTAWP